jgi:hypothetical protein
MQGRVSEYGKMRFGDDQDWVNKGVSIGHGVRVKRVDHKESQSVLERNGTADPGDHGTQ